MLRTRFGDDVDDDDDDDEALLCWRSRAVRTPSRDRKRVVESNNSNCTVAVPKVCGVARRTSAWLRTKVKALDETCKKTREETEVRDAASKFGGPVGSARSGTVAGMDPWGVRLGFRSVQHRELDCSLCRAQVTE